MLREQKQLGPKSFGVGSIINIQGYPTMTVTKVSVGILNYVKISPLNDFEKEPVYLIFDNNHKRYGITEDLKNVSWIFSDISVAPRVQAYKDLKF